jgi:hypothetical protein
MKLNVQVRGIEELRRELARLSTTTSQRLSVNAAMAGARVAARHTSELCAKGWRRRTRTLEKVRFPDI